MSSQKKNLSILYSGHYYTHNMLLYGGASYELKCARESENGRKYSLLSSMLFSAFALEAILNHLGQAKIKNWEEDRIEWYCPKEKLRIILQQLKYTPDLGTRPFQTFHEIFEFRNAIVHARTEETQNRKIVVAFEEGKSPRLPYSKWDELITLDNAEKYYKDADAMIRCLWEKSGLKRGAPGVGYAGWYEVQED